MQQELTWIPETATAAADENGKIYEEVIGKHPGFYVAIYHGAEVDPTLSVAEGRTRYRNVPMVCVRVRGEKDFNSEPLTDTHLRRFPRAARWWADHQSDRRKVSVQLLPGITPAEVAELDELGLSDCEALAQADVPANLRPFRDLAVRLRSIAKPRMRLVGDRIEEVAQCA